MTRPLIQSVAAAAMATFTAAGFSKAEAAPLGQCFNSQAAVAAALVKEKQHTYAIATTQDGKGHQGALEIFADDAGQSGYVLSSDVSFASGQVYTPGHELCIDQKLTNVTLFDARNPGVPEKAKMLENTDALERECQLLGEDCISHNVALQNDSDNLDAHVMVQAKVFESKFNNANRSAGNILTLIGRVSEVPLIINKQNVMHPGILAYSTPKGALFPKATTVDTAYGNYAISRLQR